MAHAQPWKNLTVQESAANICGEQQAAVRGLEEHASTLSVETS